MGKNTRSFLINTTSRWRPVSTQSLELVLIIKVKVFVVGEPRVLRWYEDHVVRYELLVDLLVRLHQGILVPRLEDLSVMIICH